MAFSHGKNGKLYVNGFDLTAYFNDFSTAAKAQAADATVYGLGAKTYIGGLQEGTLSAKGFFEPSPNTTDQILTSALGANDQAITFVPTGVVSTAPGVRVLTADGIETDFTVMSPVTGINAVSAQFLANNGLQGGVLLHDPTVAETTVGTIPGQTGNAGSISGIDDTPLAAIATVTAASNAGPIVITTSAAHNLFTGAAVTITGVLGNPAANGSWVVTVLTPTTFSLNGSVGNGVYTSGGTVTQATTNGAYGVFQLIGLGGTGAPTITVAKLQHSPTSGGTFTDLASFSIGAGLTAPGYGILSVPTGTFINKFIRCSVTTSGTTVSANYLATFVRL